MTSVSLTKLAVAALFGGAALLPLAAHADINQWLRHDQQRIHQGVATGQLTVREARRLEARDASIARQDRRDHYVDGGPLTNNQRRQLARELGGNTRSINHDEFRNDF